MKKKFRACGVRPTVGQRRRVRAAKAQDELPLPCSAPPCPTVIKIVCLINANDGSAVFSWRSQMQKLTSRSSTESELIALASETDDTVVFRQMLADLGLLCHVPVPVHFGDPGDTELEGGIVHEDNMSAVIIVRDRLFGARTKFLDTRLRAVRERERDRYLILKLVGTRNQLADHFTKQLSLADHNRLREVLISGGDLNV